MKDRPRPVKQWILAVLAWSLLGCETAPPEPPPAPGSLAGDWKQIGEELIARRQAENDRMRREKTVLEAKIAEAKEQIAAYRSLVGESEYRRIVGDGGVRR
jgi:hypothetical protein